MSTDKLTRALGCVATSLALTGAQAAYAQQSDFLNGLLCSGKLRSPEVGGKEGVVHSAAASAQAEGVSVPNAASITATSANSVASVAFTTVCPNISDSWATFASHNLTLSSPVSKSANTTDLASQNGLANAATLSYGFYYFFTPVQQQPSGHKAPAPGGFVLGGAGKLGYQTFKYVDTTSLKSASVNERPWSGSVYGGWQPKFAEQILFLLREEYQSSYDDAKNGTICPVTAGATQLNCASGALGTPTNKIVRLATFEFRHQLGSFAYAFAFHRDSHSGVNSVEIPVYLFQNGKGGLSGGFTAGWRSDPNTKTFGIFAAAPFSLIP